MWALPGGLVHGDLDGRQEGLEEAVRRQFEAKTGLPLDAAYMTQLGTYGDPGRDPRGNVVTVAYLAVAPAEGQPRPGEGVAEAQWRPLGLADDLAFDHARIIEDAVERVRDLIATTALAIAFCDEWFTMPYLRRVYEVIWDLEPNALDSGNFHSRITGMRGLVVRVDARESTGRQAAPVLQAWPARPQVGAGGAAGEADRQALGEQERGARHARPSVDPPRGERDRRATKASRQQTAGHEAEGVGSGQAARPKRPLATRSGRRGHLLR